MKNSQAPERETIYCVMACLAKHGLVWPSWKRRHYMDWGRKSANLWR
ncbi:hypothetical protein AALB16_10145 [Lachnospiraceae bacterium 62-35]